MKPTKIYLEDGQPREKVGTARGTATYYKNGDIDFKAYAQGSYESNIKHNPLFNDD